MSSRRGVVLVADDDEDVVRFVELNLRLHGLEVIAATDGREALRLAHEEVPDVILLDVMMPDIDGIEVCRMVRNDDRTKNVSVIMVTAKATDADRMRGFAAGADDYIVKPFDPTDLVGRVESALVRRVGEK